MIKDIHENIKKIRISIIIKGEFNFFGFVKKRNLYWINYTLDMMYIFLMEHFL